MRVGIFCVFVKDDNYHPKKLGWFFKFFGVVPEYSCHLFRVDLSTPDRKR